MRAQQQALIERYIQAYNQFDVAGMVENLHPEILFENIAEDKVTLSLQGLPAFRKQAEAALAFFSSRQQQITNWHFDEEKIRIDISYQAILAIDLPNGMKAGESLQLNGQSIFHFKKDKIIRIIDIS